MIDDRELLERAVRSFAPEPGIVERVYDRRRRRQRNRRIGALALALVIALVAMGGALQAFRHGAVPARPPGVQNGRIAFVSPGQGDDRDRLFTMEPDGSGLRSVADLRAEYPAWSPDGSTIAFDTGSVIGTRDWSTATGHVYTVRPDGSGLRQVTRGPGAELAPAWSPDGTQLAVTGVRQGDRPPGIFIVDVETGGLRPVTANPYSGQADKEPAFAPDGNQIVFVRERQLAATGAVNNLAALFIVGVDGTGLRRLTPWQAAVGTPSWSPGGSTIVFRGGTLSPDSTSQLFAIAPDGTGLRQLTTGLTAASFWPSWSPDGTRIVFTRWVFLPQNEGFRLYTIEADGSHLAPVSAAVTDEQNEPSWGPRPSGGGS